MLESLSIPQRSLQWPARKISKRGAEIRRLNLDPLPAPLSHSSAPQHEFQIGNRPNGPQPAQHVSLIYE